MISRRQATLALVAALAPKSLTRLAEHGSGDPFLDVLHPEAHGRPVGEAARLGRWSSSVPLGLVPIAAAMLPNNKILYWSGTGTQSFHDHGSVTHYGIVDLATGEVFESTVDTGQEMFCPGTSMLASGQLLIVGGGGTIPNRDAVSSYDWTNGTWHAEKSRLQRPRWYASSVTMHNGHVFAIGGDGDASSLSFEREQMGEVFNPADRSGARWRLFQGMRQPVWRSAEFVNSKAWYYQRVFQNSAGRLLDVAPSTDLVWHDLAGEGSSSIASTRSGHYQQGAVSVQFAKDRVLLAGGSPSFGDEDAYNQSVSRVSATGDAFIVDLLTGVATPTTQMNHPRYMANGVVLPDGKVLVIGGSSEAELWNSSDAVLTPEIYDPATKTWTELASNETPRMYHSVALLMPDARVWVGGGGACGDCGGHQEVNHPDAHVYSPPYLFAGPRPTLWSGDRKMVFGRAYSIKGNGVDRFALVRMSSVTHATNTDQRYVELPILQSLDLAVDGGGEEGRIFRLGVPEYGTNPPGYYMLFGISKDGVPSMAQIVQVIWG